MNDVMFVAKLYSNNLLPGDLKNVIELLSTKAQKADKFLDSVVKPTIDSDDGTRFGILLEVMKDDEDDNVKRLANTILCTIKQGFISRKIAPGRFNICTYICSVQILSY